MKHKLTYLAVALFFTLQLAAQELQLPLANANAQLFRGHLYCYGFSTRDQKTAFCIYKLNAQLKMLDSLIVPLGRNSTELYLQTYSDTLHDFMNVYLQKKEKKLVTILRFSKKFELIATIENVDVARLNGISAFESELLYAGKAVYTVKTQKDSSGQQFYLNKFNLKSELKNFEYEFAWQFPFDRQHINSAHLFYADRRAVFLYVNVTSGPKAGQWILAIHSTTGKLIRGTKLNDKGEMNTYQFGNFVVDTLKKNLIVAGQKLTEAQLKQAENKLALVNAPAAGLYYTEIDSLGEISSKQDFKIPITGQKSGAKKTAGSLILRLGRIKKSSDEKVSLETDIYKNTDNTLCYWYAGTTQLRLTPGEESMDLVLEKTSLSPEPLIEKFYVIPDKTDRNGKVAVDSLSDFEKLYYKPLNFPVKQAFQLNAENNAVWLLKKSLPKKNTINYTLLAPVKKIYQLTPLEEINAVNHPLCLRLSDTLFMISQQVEENSYKLKVFAW